MRNLSIIIMDIFLYLILFKLKNTEVLYMKQLVEINQADYYPIKSTSSIEIIMNNADKN